MTGLNLFCSYCQYPAKWKDTSSFFPSHLHLSLKGWKVREASNERPSGTPFLQHWCSTGRWVRGFNFLKMLVLTEVGKDTHRETTPTTGLSVSSKINFLGLYARQCQEAELGLWGVSPPSAMLPSAEEETPWLMPTLGQGTAAWWRRTVLAGSGFPMKLKRQIERKTASELRAQTLTGGHSALGWRGAMPGQLSQFLSWESEGEATMLQGQSLCWFSCCNIFLS